MPARGRGLCRVAGCCPRISLTVRSMPVLLAVCSRAPGAQERGDWHCVQVVRCDTSAFDGYTCKTTGHHTDAVFGSRRSTPAESGEVFQLERQGSADVKGQRTTIRARHGPDGLKVRWKV